MLAQRTVNLELGFVEKLIRGGLVWKQGGLSLVKPHVLGLIVTIGQFQINQRSCLTIG